MTPFESLLWNVWLPKVRTSINNDWSPEEPRQAVKLYEAWSTFLPPFIRDNLLDQLILPKVQKAVANWNTKQAKVSLQTIVFPWLPHVGLRMEEVVGDARRKIRNVLRNWVVDETIPTDLVAWKDVSASFHALFIFILTGYSLYRCSMLVNGMLCSSNTLYRNSGQHCATTSESILGIRKWKACIVSLPGPALYVHRSCLRFWKPNSSPSGWMSFTSGSSSPV